MSQNPNEGGYFTNLLTSNQRQYGGASNSSSPSPQSPNPSPPYGSQPINPNDVYRNQQFAFQQGFASQQQFNPSPLFYNPNQPSTFPPSQPIQPSQPNEGTFKVPKPRSPPKGRGKKTKAQRGKNVVNLDADDDDDLEEIGHTRARKLWSKAEETLLAEAWIEVSQDEELGNDKENEFFWNEIHALFSERTTEAPRTKNMLSGKWSRMNADCQKFHAIYKHLERRSGENDHDHVENAKTSFSQRFGQRGFNLVHVWEILKRYPKWDAEEPLDITCLEDIFGPDKRPRPERTNRRPGKKPKSTDTSSAASSGGSQTSTFSAQLSEKYNQAKDAQTACYEARRKTAEKQYEKEAALAEWLEMNLLMLEPNNVTDPIRAEVIRKRQARITKKYYNLDRENDE